MSGPARRPPEGSADFLAARHYRVLGTEVAIRAAPPADRVLSRLLGPFSRVGEVRHPPILSYALDENGGRWRLLEGGTVLDDGSDWESLVVRLVAEINRRAIERFDQFAVHAGVVARPDSRVVAFPSASGGGKSTLTAACLRAGFDYVSDEALCLDLAGGAVIPYPKPLSLTPWAAERLGIESGMLGGTGELLVDPETLGARRAGGALRLSDLVLLERGPGPPELAPLPRVETTAALLGYSFNHYRRPQASFELATGLASRCRPWRLRYEDPLAAAALLWDRLSPEG